MYKNKTPQIFTDFKAEVVIVHKTSKYKAIYARTHARSRAQKKNNIFSLSNTHQWKDS